jgi:hypothetical protein
MRENSEFLSFFNEKFKFLFKNKYYVFFCVKLKRKPSPSYHLKLIIF